MNIVVNTVVHMNICTLQQPMDPMQDKAQPLSGSPGYQRGAPLLAGSLANGGKAIARHVYGLSLLANDASGRCTGPSSTPLGTQLAAFSVDMHTACVLDFSLQDLKTFCSTGRGPAWLGAAPAIAEHFLGLPAQLFVGAWGSAEPATLEDWVEVVRESSGVLPGALVFSFLVYYFFCCYGTLGFLSVFLLFDVSSVQLW